ncbi:MAG: inositol-3-phosphate synthase [Deltaproteobacteria bacterium]|nr:inositol-3-phosphate synthase [Deltaproteobacteria bacterium]
MTIEAKQIKPSKGKLGVLLVGLGAVSTTFIAGVESAKKKLRKPIGSLTQMGMLDLGQGKNKKYIPYKEFLPLAGVDDLVYGAWDIFPDNGYEAAIKAGVIPRDLLDKIKDDLSNTDPMPAVFDSNYCRKLHGSHVKSGANKMALAESLMKDMDQFKSRFKCDRLTMVWCASTEAYCEITEAHRSLSKFEEGLKNSDPSIPPSMIYAYAAMKMGMGYSNGAPNLTTDCPALLELAELQKVPVSGKDLKTGQTLLKTILAPGIAARYLGLTGWFSNNILGNRDGEVLDDPENFKTKEISKLSVLDSILRPDLYPDLYGNLYHKVRINYYPPRGDNKEGWDNLDILGWLGMPMQLKVDFLCRDSILAAPLVLDLALLMDLSHRAGLVGIQEWLSFFYKSPLIINGHYPEHNLFTQEFQLKQKMCEIMGVERL